MALPRLLDRAVPLRKDALAPSTFAPATRSTPRRRVWPRPSGTRRRFLEGTTRLRLRSAGGLALLLLAGAPDAALAQPEPPVQLPTGFVDQIVVGDLRLPTGMAFLPDGRLLVVEQAGGIRMVVDGKLAAVDPVGLVDSVKVSGEQGLTGIAVDYRWPVQPYVYVYYDALGNACRITRYRAEGDLTDPTSGFLSLDPGSKYHVLRDIPDASGFHNGGSVRFGVDGKLYAGLGDDAFACGAQDSSSLRGVMLRMTVDNLPDGPGGPPNKADLVPADNPWAGHGNPNARLVWSIGLRNPFRFHVDPVTGNLFVADVGFNLFEEIDLVDGPLINFGWPYLEGPAPFVSSCSGIAPGVYRDPIHTYDRSGFVPANVIGAGVYRGSPCIGCNFPVEYYGDYFFSDYTVGFLRRLKFSDGVWDIAPVVPGQPNATDWATGLMHVTDYLVGPDGALWYVKMSHDFSLEDSTGEVRRIFYSPELAGVEDPTTSGVELSAPWPSPSRGEARVLYRTSRTARVDLALFDALGRRVRTLVPSGVQTAGKHTVVWDGRLEGGRPAPSGYYVIRLNVDGFVQERRLPLIR